MTDANPNDVLCGRGGKINGHSGNRAFRSLVKQHQQIYLKAKKKMKPNVAASIVAIIHGYDPPGRFLKKDVATGAWYSIGDDRAREKTSQALREGAPEIKKISNIKHVGGKSNNNTSSRGVKHKHKHKRVNRTLSSSGRGGGGEENQINGCSSSSTSSYLNNAGHQQMMEMPHNNSMMMMMPGYRQQSLLQVKKNHPTSLSDDDAGDPSLLLSAAADDATMAIMEHDYDEAMVMTPLPAIYVKKALPYPIRRIEATGESFESMSPEEKLQWKDFDPPRWSPITTTVADTNASSSSYSITTATLTARAVSAVKETPANNASTSEDRVPSANIFGSIAHV